VVDYAGYVHYSNSLARLRDETKFCLEVELS
jgi:hypothetical protein